MTLTRRESAMGIAATAASGLLRAVPAANDPPAQSLSAAAGDLYAHSFVFDANSSPTVAEPLPLSRELVELNRGSGITALKKSLGGINANFYAATAELGFNQLLIEKHPDTFLQVRVAADFEDNPEAMERFRKSIEERRRAGVAAPGEDRPAYIPELNTPRKIERVVEALLKRGHPGDTVRKVIGGNFRRALETIWRES